jgi:LmbE family N-acetylglucosaminyl deacetylase
MKQRILVFSAHPDDAETCCGGTICRLSDAGHRVHILHLTCSAPIRAREAAAAAKTMGATVEVWDFPDGGMRVDPDGVSRVRVRLARFKPHLVLAHWPVDFHPDHQATGCLVLQALNQLEEKLRPWPELHFFEACPGYQSYYFHPNHYVDITPYVARKRDAVARHASVNCLDVYPIHETAHKSRGYESGYRYAEGFIRLPFRRGATRHQVIGEGREKPAAPSNARETQRSVRRQ